MRPCWGHLGRCWGYLVAFRGHLRPSWAHVGAILRDDRICKHRGMRGFINIGCWSASFGDLHPRNNSENESLEVFLSHLGATLGHYLTHGDRMCGIRSTRSTSNAWRAGAVAWRWGWYCVCHENGPPKFERGGVTGRTRLRGGGRGGASISLSVISTNTNRKNSLTLTIITALSPLKGQAD